MATALYILVYAALLVFLAAVVHRVVRYMSKPMHIRWELYPVAHEGDRASYGGGYLENVDWWTKPRTVSLLGELKVMVPEILLLKAVWEHNRPLWWVTFPFHAGLYLFIGWIILLIFGAALALAGVPVGQGGGVGSIVGALTNFVGPLSFIVCLIGAAGLFYRRLTNAEMRNYSSFGHYFNLALFIGVMLLQIAAWLIADPSFAVARGFVAGLLTFTFAAVESGLFMAAVLASAAVLAYIPLTHMAHFFMKYFLYHDIRWGDKPNVDSPETSAKIAIALNYPVSWAAEHIRAAGVNKTWAEVATFNPQAKAEGGKE